MAYRTLHVNTYKRMRELIEAGLRGKDIAELCNVGNSTVSEMKSRMKKELVREADLIKSILESRLDEIKKLPIGRKWNE